MSNNKVVKDFSKSHQVGNGKAGNDPTNKGSKQPLIFSFKERCDGKAERVFGEKKRQYNLFEKGIAFMNFQEALDYLRRTETLSLSTLKYAFQAFHTATAGIPIKLLEEVDEFYWTHAKKRGYHYTNNIIEKTISDDSRID